MKIYIIRHGETDWNKAGRIQGWSDRSLNKYGYDLARRTGEAIRDSVHFDLCFTSPLKRAASTAGALLLSQPEYPMRFERFLKEHASRHPGYSDIVLYDNMPVIVDERIKEVCFGSWEGLCIREPGCPVSWDTFVQFFAEPGSGLQPEGGETIPGLVQRTGAFLNDISMRPELQDKTILISTHGAAMRAMMYNLYTDKEDFWQGHIPVNCEMILVEKDTEGHLFISDPGFVPAAGD